VIDALRRGHATDARAAMRAHIMHAGDLLATHLDADRRWE
jgi:DNA-binding GntR family transcriptional regulator